MLVTTAISTAVWLTVTMLTPPETMRCWSVLPAGPAWRDWVATGIGAPGLRIRPVPGGSLAWVNWIAGVAAVYSAVFGVGEFLTGSSTSGWVYSLVAIGSFLLIQRNLRADKTLEGALTAPRVTS